MSVLAFVCRVGSEVLEPVSLLAREIPTPACACPVCQEPVVFVRGRFARHRRGTECARREPESEAHRSTKIRLAAELVSRPAWLLLSRLWTMPRTWTRAELEVCPPGMADRLDVGFLTTSGRVALALEVCDTSPVTALKAAALDRAGIPWIEVKARPVAEHPADWGGVPSAPLRVERAGAALRRYLVPAP